MPSIDIIIWFLCVGSSCVVSYNLPSSVNLQPHQQNKFFKVIASVLLKFIALQAFFLIIASTLLNHSDQNFKNLIALVIVSFIFLIYKSYEITLKKKNH